MIKEKFITIIWVRCVDHGCHWFCRRRRWQTTVPSNHLFKVQAVSKRSSSQQDILWLMLPKMLWRWRRRWQTTVQSNHLAKGQPEIKRAAKRPNRHWFHHVGGCSILYSKYEGMFVEMKVCTGLYLHPTMSCLLQFTARPRLNLDSYSKERLRMCCKVLHLKTISSFCLSVQYWNWTNPLFFYGTEEETIEYADAKERTRTLMKHQL